MTVASHSTLHSSLVAIGIVDQTNCHSPRQPRATEAGSAHCLHKMMKPMLPMESLCSFQRPRDLHDLNTLGPRKASFGNQSVLLERGECHRRTSSSKLPQGTPGQLKHCSRHSRRQRTISPARLEAQQMSCQHTISVSSRFHRRPQHREVRVDRKHRRLCVVPSTTDS